jgi:hypothetical protein
LKYTILSRRGGASSSSSVAVAAVAAVAKLKNILSFQKTF